MVGAVRLDNLPTYFINFLLFWKINTEIIQTLNITCAKEREIDI
jgi:hypothetical protein